MTFRFSSPAPALLANFGALCLCFWGSAWGQDSPPKTGLEAITVPEGFVVEKVAGNDLTEYPMVVTFDDRGRLYIAESSGLNVSGLEMSANPKCRIRVLEDSDGDGVFDKSQVFADKLTLPMGLLWREGSLYVASPPDFLRFDDTDGDGVADREHVVLTRWNVLNTASLHGPYFGPDGWMYLTHGRHGYKITTKEGELLQGQAARIWRCRPDGSGLERVCGGGFDNPVELDWTSAGEMLGTMTYFTDPRNGQRDALNHWIEGGVYPKPHEVIQEFTRTGELLPSVTHFARVAPCGFIRYRSDSFGPEYKGNLFSAHFNPHRIQRHVLYREGGSFRTRDSDFLTSSDPDFHPSDVEQDADGSLLVVDTGAWYVHACPLSRISKPELKGAIYRVRHTDAPRVEDPRGLRIDLGKQTPKQLVGLMEDPRPALQGRVQEELVARGESAISALVSGLQIAKATDTRCRVVWALHRIGTPKARKALRQALGDSSPDVVVAALMSLGLSRDVSALKEIQALSGHGSLAVRRQVVEALGRLGKKQAIPSILKSLEGVHDPFLEHAATYALIRLGGSPAVASALAHSDPTVRKAAMITLDQLGGGQLSMESATSMLGDPDANLRKASMWVCSRHPDWGDGVAAFLRERLSGEAWSEAEGGSVRESLLAFAADPGIQALVAELLADTSTSVERKSFLLGTIQDSKLPSLPPTWIDALRALLAGANAELRWETLALIRARGLADFDADLAALAVSPNESDALRVAAYGALIKRASEVGEAGIDLLIRQLDPSVDPTLRLDAAQTLGRARMTPARLKHLAEEVVPKADGVILPSILEAFRKGSDEQAGQSLVAALLASSENQSLLTEGSLRDLLSTYPESVRAALEPLYARMRELEVEKARRIQELEPLLAKGDVTRGRQVFFNQKAACFTCHAIGNEGGDLGPDLTSIGAIRSGRDLLEAVLFPNASFVPDYEPFQVETDEELLTGVIGLQTAEVLVLKTGADSRVRIPRDQVIRMTPSTVSVMPSGLDGGLTQEELLDLMAFLRAQNGNQWLLPNP